MIQLAVSGAQGRMGQTIINSALSQDVQFQISTLLEHKDHPKAKESVSGIALSTDNSSINGCDVLIEFTTPEATMDNLKACTEHGVKMVIGTTGFNQDQIGEIHKASEKTAIVFASNMSIGVNVLFKLIEVSANKIGAKKISIQETHHIHKKDKPSGTAKTMADIAEKASGLKVEDISSLREGEIVGNHSITLDSEEDLLEISHQAKNRSMFAKGALTAA